MRRCAILAAAIGWAAAEDAPWRLDMPCPESPRWGTVSPATTVGVTWGGTDYKLPCEEFRLHMPPGRWDLVARSRTFDPLVMVEGAGGRLLSNDDDPAGGTTDSRLSLVLAESAVLTITVAAAAVNASGTYQFAVVPTRPAPEPAAVGTWRIATGAGAGLPTAAGRRAAVPLLLALDAGRRYHLRLAGQGGDPALVLPAQHGLPALAVDDIGLAAAVARGLPAETAELVLIAPRTGRYLLWCVDARAAGRFDGTLEVARSEPMAGDPNQEAEALVRGEPDAGFVTLWSRHRMWMNPSDPELMIPLPTGTPLTVEVVSRGATCAYRIGAGERETVLAASDGGSAEAVVTLPDGSPGLRLAAADAQAGTAWIRVRKPLATAVATARGVTVRTVALPAVLQGRVGAGTRISVAVRGHGVSPQATLRGAGLGVVCADPTGYSPTATIEGIATRDGGVELVVTEPLASDGAVAEIAWSGLVLEPPGAGGDLDIDDIPWLAAPGAPVLAVQGDLGPGDAPLPDGTRVDWLRLPVRGDHAYRVVVHGDATPDLVLDVPGQGRRTVAAGTAVLRPGADGEATIGVAGPVAGTRIAYALLADDLGPRSATAGARP
ncbi:MAG: hypothetical protein RLZZ127_1781 [Planctomycetota bacterium]|jgi:hypothetical protein